MNKENTARNYQDQAGRNSQSPRRTVWHGSVWECLHVLLMVAAAAYLRFPGLGELSLYGDEDYSVLAVQAILSDGFPHMPSGMAYWRGTPYSYLAAGAALLFGVNEFSIRLPSALFGVVTVPIFFSLAKRFIGLLPATLASWLLVFSAWHVDMSREGRMYSMFLALVLLGLLFFYQGFIKRQRGFKIPAVLTAALTLSLHELSILVLVVWAIALVFHTSTHSRRDRFQLVLVISGLSILWLGFTRFQALVRPGALPVDSLTTLGNVARLGFTPKFWMLSHILSHNVALFVVLLLASSSLLYWIWSAHREQADFPRYFAAGSLTLVALATVNLFGVVSLALLLLLFWNAQNLRDLLRTRYCRRVLLSLAAIFAFWLFYGALLWRGEALPIASNADLLRKIVKDSLYYPALHVIAYLEAFPVMTAIVVAGTLAHGYFCRKAVAEHQSAAVLFPWFWLPLLVLGFKREWISLRYTVMLYPFFLMIFAWTVYHAFQAIWRAIRRPLLVASPSSPQQWQPKVIALYLLMLLAPILNEQHGLHDAWKTSRLSYGQYISPLFHGFPIHPDHKTPAEYVRSRLRPNDVVIAMDLFPQYYYLRKVNYWLRPINEMERYSFTDGIAWYDIYTKTPVITRTHEVEEIIAHSNGSRVWLITSGELEQHFASLFPADLIEFLSASGPNVVSVGQDKLTKVYFFETPA